MKYGIVLKEKYGVDGLTRNEVIDLFDMLNNIEAYPIELCSRINESSGMGFITSKAARMVDYDYESSGLHDFIANTLDDRENESENCEYEFEGIKIWLSR